MNGIPLPVLAVVALILGFGGGYAANELIGEPAVECPEAPPCPECEACPELDCEDTSAICQTCPACRVCK